MKLCINCVHFIPEGRRCANVLSPVDGQPSKEPHALCERQRAASEKDGCAAKGKNFKAKPEG